MIKTNPDEPITPFMDGQGMIASNVDMVHLEGMGAMIGLTKRECFAGLAMQGLLASITLNTLPTSVKIQMAVECTNALIDELNKVSP